MVAAEAYIRAVRLSVHSCFERADDYLNLGRSVASLWGQNQEQAKSLSRDALKALTEYDQRFAKSPEVKAQRLLVECQLRSEERRVGKECATVGHRTDAI